MDMINSTMDYQMNIIHVLIHDVRMDVMINMIIFDLDVVVVPLWMVMDIVEYLGLLFLLLDMDVEYEFG